MKESVFSYSLPNFLKEQDPEIAQAMGLELSRQEEGLELIASENYVSESVMAAMGSILTNKYAEGYPGKRYYGGCQHVDTCETLACDRLRELFSCDDNSSHPYMANVQPHSGAQANMAVFLAMLEPGDSLLGLDLSHGGHLTHGSPVNFSGKLFRSHHYEVDKETELLNYESIYRQAMEFKPKMIIGGASAYSQLWDFEKLSKIAKEANAYLLVDMAHIAGLVAAGLHPSPIGHADFITSTTHKTLRGPRGGIILSKPEYAKKINSAVFPGMQGGPLMHVIGAKAVAFQEALSPKFKQYQGRVLENASALANSLASGGLRIVSGGTKNHLVCVHTKELTGKEVERVLDTVHITVNKNTIPFETRSPFVTSGIRLGTPAVTTRGLGVKEMNQIGQAIATVCKELAQQTDTTQERTLSSATTRNVQELVAEICYAFPVYGLKTR